MNTCIKFDWLTFFKSTNLNRQVSIDLNVITELIVTLSHFPSTLLLIPGFFSCQSLLILLFSEMKHETFFKYHEIVKPKCYNKLNEMVLTTHLLTTRTSYTKTRKTMK